MNKNEFQAFIEECKKETAKANERKALATEASKLKGVKAIL